MVAGSFFCASLIASFSSSKRWPPVSKSATSSLTNFAVMVQSLSMFSAALGAVLMYFPLVTSYQPMN